MDTGSRKEALRYFFDKVVEPIGFKFTPDEELADFLLEQEVLLESKHGIPFCPCQPRRPLTRHAYRLSVHSVSPEAF
jgi:ferredoxin-thioredoxin reductase catalytic subunit